MSLHTNMLPFDRILKPDSSQITTFSPWKQQHTQKGAIKTMNKKLLFFFITYHKCVKFNQASFYFFKFLENIPTRLLVNTHKIINIISIHWRNLL